MLFDMYAGIDYSGAGTSLKQNEGLQVYVQVGHSPCIKSVNPYIKSSGAIDWTRSHIADWILEHVKLSQRFIIGIDHAFSYPRKCVDDDISNWDEFLQFFVKKFPTHIGSHTVQQYKAEIMRFGDDRSYRLTDKWSSSAKSIFKFGVPGQVGPSTHAGIP